MLYLLVVVIGNQQGDRKMKNYKLNVLSENGGYKIVASFEAPTFAGVKKMAKSTLHAVAGRSYTLYFDGVQCDPSTGGQYENYT